MGRKKALLSRSAVFACSVLAVVLALLNVLVSVHLMSLDLGFYRTQWAACRVPEDTGMTPDELNRAGLALTGYFTGQSDTPQIQANIDGKVRPLYGDAELLHLKDVRSLFSAGFSLERALAAVGLAGILYLLPAKRRRALGAALLIAAGICIAVLVALGIPAKMDFAGWWTDFHLVTFSNDLWMLDPATDWLIRMFPAEFFFSSVERIGRISAGISLLYVVSGLLVRHFSADNRHLNS